MSNADLLVTVIKQAGTTEIEAHAIAEAVERNGSVLVHECVPALDRIVSRLQQATAAAISLQQRAHGTPAPKVG